jgi:hypothetical protein
MRFSDQGILNTTRASNAKEECKKIKGIGKIVMQVTGFRPKYSHGSLSDDSF